MNFDPVYHPDYAMFCAVNELWYYLVCLDEDEFTETMICADIEVLLEK